MSELTRVDHLGVDGAHRRLHGRRAEPGEQAEEHVAGQRQGHEPERGHRAGAHQQGQGEHAAHAPDAHPATRDGPRDRLPDGCRGQHQAGGAIRARHVLDVQKHREGEHPCGKTRDELGGDDAGHTSCAQEISVTSHEDSIVGECRARIEAAGGAGAAHPPPPNQGPPERHATRRGDVPAEFPQARECPWLPLASILWITQSEARVPGLFIVL